MSKSIEDILKLLAMGETLNESQQKQMKDYKFWKTQPVPSLDDKIDAEGPIETKTPADVPAEPLPLLPEFTWSTIDITKDSELEEVYQLLYDHYVEDQDATFRFQYSHEFLRWALQPPHWNPDWYVGVRVKSTGKLVGFISAIPVTLKMTRSGAVISAVEINFLCVHKKLRSKRLAPILIKEITRRVNRTDVWQALYTAGVVLPSPVSVCRYAHRPLNWSKLHDVGFSLLPPGQTPESMDKRYELPSKTRMNGWRAMTRDDVAAVHELHAKYLAKFGMVQQFSIDEMEHWFVGSEVVKAYVVETEGRITDFVSFYLLPFTVLGNAQHSELGIAYLYYYATDATDIKPRLEALIGDALVAAKEFGVDVFNCLTSQDNTYFIKPLQFGPGDGFLNYYLFNYKTWPLEGGIDKKTKQVVDDQTSGVGVVLL